MACGPLTAAAFLVGSVGSTASGLQSWWHVGLVALRHVGSSWARDRTCVPCIARCIVNHWTTREAPIFFFFQSHLVYANCYGHPREEKKESERQLCSRSKQHPPCSFLGSVRAWASNPGIWVQTLNLGTEDIFMNLHKPQLPHLYNGDKGAPCFLRVSWE